MRVPQFNQQVGQDQAPNVRVQGGLSPGEAVGMVGSQIDGIANLVNTGASIYQQQQDQANKARVAQVTAEAQNDLNDYLYNNNTGLLTLKGERALVRDSGQSLTEETLDWFAGVASEKSETLSNNVQKRLFNENMLQLRGQAQRISTQHLFNESQKYQKDAFEAEIDANLSSVALNYSDKETTDSALIKIATTAQGYGQELGWNQAQIDQFTKEQQNKAIIDAINIMQTNGDGANIPQYVATYKEVLNPQNLAKTGKLIQDNNADLFVANILEYKNDPDELDRYIVALRDSKSSFYKQIGPQNVPAVLGKAVQYREAYDRRQEAELKARNTDGKEALTELEKDIKSGIPFSSHRLSTLMSRTEGTESAPQAQLYAQYLPVFQRMYSMPSDAREMYVNGFRSEAKTKEFENPQDVAFILDQLEGIHESMLNLEKDNAPVAYSIKMGTPLPTVPTSSLIQNDPVAINLLKENIKKISAADQSGGSSVASHNPLTKQNIDELNRFWKSASPNAQLSLITSLFKASGGNSLAARDMIQSVAGKNDSYRLAASLSNQGLTDIAGQIVTGQSLLDKGAVKVDENALRQKTSNYLKGIVAEGSPVYKIYLDSIKANYAYIAQKSEKLTDKSGKLDTKNIDSEIFDKAALNVTGGKYTSGSVFGAKSTVLRPHTVGEKGFREQLEQFNSKNAREYGGSDKDYFLDLPLEQDPTNPYRYYFKNGAKYVMDNKTRTKRLTFIVR